MDAHGAVVWTADAPKERSVARAGGGGDITELFRGIANDLNESCLVGLCASVMAVPGTICGHDEWCADDKATQQCQTQDVRG